MTVNNVLILILAAAVVGCSMQDLGLESPPEAKEEASTTEGDNRLRRKPNGLTLVDVVTRYLQEAQDSDLTAFQMKDDRASLITSAKKLRLSFRGSVVDVDSSPGPGKEVCDVHIRSANGGGSIFLEEAPCSYNKREILSGGCELDRISEAGDWVVLVNCDITEEA